MAELMTQKDGHHGEGVGRASRPPGGGDREDEQNDVEGESSHGKIISRRLKELNRRDSTVRGNSSPLFGGNRYGS